MPIVAHSGFVDNCEANHCFLTSSPVMDVIDSQVYSATMSIKEKAKAKSCIKGFQLKGGITK